MGGLRLAFEAILVVVVGVALRAKQWKWVVVGGALGVVGLMAWPSSSWLGDTP